MMQQYQFSKDRVGQGTNTSTELVSKNTPSQQAIQNIRAFARCIQTVKAQGRVIKICLN